MEIQNLIRKYESKSLTLPAVPVAYIQVENLDEKLANASEHHSQQNCVLPFARTNCYTVPIKSSRLLTKSNQNVKRVYELLLDIEDINDFQFNPGDTIGILPTNPNDDVSVVLRATSLTDLCSQRISIQPIAGGKKKLPNYLPQETTIRKCLSECLDIRAIPKKLFLRSLIDHLMDDEERRALSILCSKEGATDYSKRILDAGTVFLDILKMFQSWNEIPLRLLLEHLPRLLPRPYSIANSPLNDQNVLKIWFSVDEPAGVTTKMLSDMIEKVGKNVSPVIPIYLRQSNSFMYTRNEMNDPTILIAAGVGVSPFLGFLEHRDEVRKSENGIQLGDVTLLYGCRHENDNLCKDILKGYLRTGSLNDLKEAFSRDVQSKHKYVQDLIEANGNLFVVKLLKENGRVYVCGSVKMLQGVRKSIQNCLANISVDSNAETIDYVQKFVNDKRYIEDTWL